jgi:protein AATF/BFR2
MSRPTLAQQLKQLEAEEKTQTVDPESAYSNLDGLDIPERKGNEGREHYLDVGPSRLRGQFGDMGDRYGGQVRGRQKIFDDDDDEDEEEDDEADEEEGDGESMEGEDDEEEDGDGDEDEAEGDDDEEDEDDDDDEEVEEEDLPPPPPKSTSSSSRLDPVAALRDSRMKDSEKGQAIKRQKVTLLSTILTSIDMTGDL